MAEKTNNIIYRIEVDSKSGKINVDGVTKSFEQADKAFLKLQKDVAKGIPNATKNVKNLGDATGSATSATMELSRVISDAPYGIRGMANNITQLVSQLGTASTKAGGLGGALKLMGKQLLGPLGIVFAITAAVSALDFFFGAATKASSSASDYEESLVSLRKTMDDLNISQEDVNDKIEDYIVLSDLKNKLDKSQEDSTERLKEIEEDLVSAREDNAKKQKGLLKELSVAQYEALSDEEKMAFRKENLTTNFDKRFKQLKKNIKEEGDLETEKRLIMSQSLDIQKEYNDAKKKFNAAEEGTLQALKNAKKEKEKERELLSKTSEDYKRLTIAIDEYQKKIEEIEGKKTKGKNKRDRAKAFDTKQLQKDSLAYVKELMKVDEKIALLSAKDKKSRLIIQRDFHLKRLIATHGANSELVKAYKKYYRQLIDAAEEGELELLAKEGAKGMGGAPRDKNKDAEKIKERQRLLTQVKLEALMESSQAIAGFIDGEFQREITIERNKTNALNNELRERLNNENISKSERKSIQLEIARNDEALRKKQEKVEKKRFKMQKAANVSQALISTYLAVAQVQANPLDLNPVTKGISMAATLAAGLANVATLARQKFQSSAGATSTAGALGGGGGSGGNDRSFNFNLAGASRENQLASTLQGRFDQPLQAYVVSRDITNQQQLDQDILTNASFG